MLSFFIWSSYASWGLYQKQLYNGRNVYSVHNSTGSGSIVLR